MGAIRAEVGYRNLYEVVEIVEYEGTATAAQVFKRLDRERPSSHASKYCLRAVKMGLMTANREVWPMQYQAVPNWRAILDGDVDDPWPLPSADEVLAQARNAPNSVWQLGKRAMGA